MPAPVRYRVVIAEPHTHTVEIEAVFPPAAGGDRLLHLPVWTPGSYLVRDFARHLSDLEASADGRRVAAVKTGKSTWRFAGVEGALTVRYQVYAYERTVRTSHVSAEHAFLSPPTVFLYAEEQRGLAHEVEVRAPRGWRVASALPERRGRFAAAGYDQLADSPFECGRFDEFRFRAGGVPFRVLWCGSGNPDLARLRREMAKVAEAERRLFGSFPFPSYLAIVHLTPAGKGGLEHRASTALEWPRYRFKGGEQHEDFLALFAHELFHAWNVKASAPATFRPYDYLKETPTRLLWWFEGVTDYYDELLLVRAGLLEPKAYLERLKNRWEKLQDSPGRRKMSVAEASFDAWIKHYRPDEDSANSSVSYYDKGHLVGALLDLEIRRRTRGRKSLDHVLRLVTRRGRKGLPEDGVERAAGEVTGAPIAGWFRRYVHGTRELPFAGLLATAGLELAAKEGRQGGWLGATLKSAGGRLTLASVVAGGPAESAGLSAFDELLAADGNRIDEETLKERLEERRPGERMKLSYFRDEVLQEATVRLGRPPARSQVEAVSRPTAEQRRTLKSWLGARHPDLG